MNKQHSQMSTRELKLYMVGFIIVISLFIVSIIFGRFTTPLMLLRLRLGMVAAGFIYFSIIYIYYERVSKLQAKMDDVIIILLNGKEFRR
ncbi:hypothetical protein MUB24_19410 [Lederbergia sp. NSJ-179]|uniref:hypothetical protein n=1 Tax=Lederbergia sp. NSJ-179 TaxID=2931402 RepID=UPI001FCFB321|nr:hypothetical protein [Lederbergia sp. NSJ-179]MCJ7843003.1 hypothetical protein [Lederbergia sp. NSJ-179]